MTQRLLFADDSLTMHRVVEITFGREDVTLVAAHSGAEALKLAAQNALDVALIDVQLGDLDGYSLCEQLRALRPNAPLPVLLLVSDQHPVDEAKLAACGAVGWVKKPFDTRTLVLRVHQAQSQGATAAMPSASQPAERQMPRPAFFQAPPPIPTAEPAAMAAETTNPWTVGQGGPPQGLGAPAANAGIPLPKAQDLPELPTWTVDLPDPAPVAAAMPPPTPPHEPLWTEKEASTSEDLRRPQIDAAIAQIARADAALGPQAPAPSSPSSVSASLEAHTQAALSAALRAMPAPAGGPSAEAWASALTPVLVQTIERVLWDVLPTIAQAQVRAYYQEHPPK
jgi:CheY-like chemotaxis protein